MDMGSMTGRQLEGKAASALEGRRFWLSLEGGYQLTSRSQVVLVPHREPVYMETAKENLGWLAVHKKADKILVLGTGGTGMPGSTTGGVPCFYQAAGSSMCSHLLDFYSLYEFTVNLQVVSLSLPEGRKGQKLVDTGRLTLKEALSVIVFENYGQCSAPGTGGGIGGVF